MERKKEVKSRLDNARPASMDRPDYRQYNRLHREKLVHREHARNVARMHERVASDAARRKREDVPALIARPGGPPGSAYRHLYDADRGLPPQRELARELGGSEDLVHELGGDSAPLAYLRRPPRPASVGSRLADVAEARRAGGAPPASGLTTRERCVLWGTSLADIPAIDEAAPQAVVARRVRSARGSGKEGASQRPVVPLTPQSVEALKGTRKRILDSLLEDSWCTEKRVLEVMEDAWEKTLVVHRPQLLELLCEIMLQMGLGQMAADFRKRKAPAGSSAARGSGKGVGTVRGFR